MYPYGSPEWLDDLRTLLIFGWLAAGVLAVMVWDKPTKPPAPKGVIYCPLHRVDRRDCEHKHSIHQ